jgi:catechol 2,3-dioxygenase-like lactoylglutathione lyase family enzyme
VIRRLNHVGVVVADLEAAKSFLRDVLGLELVLERDVPAKQRSTAYFAAGEVDIELIEDRDPAAKQRVLGGAQAVIEHIALDVDDLVRTVETLKEKGVAVRDDAIVRVGSRDHAWTEPETSGGVMYQLSVEATEEAK